MAKRKPLKKPSGSAHQRAKGLHPILVWVTAEQKDTLRTAADASGHGALTSFLLTAALDRAAEIRKRRG